MKEYTLEVEGRFTANIDITGIHCGLDERPVNSFRYKVRICADTLDRDGFVVDNMDVKNYFENLGQVSVSCENLAARACRDLWKDRFTKIQVKVWGTEWSNVQCTRLREVAA